MINILNAFRQLGLNLIRIIPFLQLNLFDHEVALSVKIVILEGDQLLILICQVCLNPHDFYFWVAPSFGSSLVVLVRLQIQKVSIGAKIKIVFFALNWGIVQHKFLVCHGGLL